MPRNAARVTVNATMAEPARQLFTFDDYVQLEEMSTVKHEYLEGHVWAMAGGSPDHAAICVNVGALLVTQLRGKPCRVYSSDLRIRVRATGLGTYPDVSVVCGKLELDPDNRKQQTAINPRLIVEVLSPSTEDYDRGEKLQHYQRIASLEEIVLVAHERRHVDVFSRHGGAWHKSEYEGGSALLESLECELPIDEVYRDPLATERSGEPEPG